MMKKKKRVYFERWRDDDDITTARWSTFLENCDDNVLKISKKISKCDLMTSSMKNNERLNYTKIT